MYSHLTMTDLETGLVELGASPKNNGTLELIVSRPAVGERIVLEQGQLDTADGLIGDNWRARGSKILWMAVHALMHRSPS